MWRSCRHLLRLIEIVRCLARHNALFFVDLLPLPATVLWFCQRLSNRKAPGRQGQRLARALQELGPSFIKFGQSLATRADLFGERFAADLAELQDRLPPFDGKIARNLIESELDTPLNDLFEQFDDQPIAAASIAQVHFATTTEGEEVAVKVLRPGIERQMAADLDLFAWIAGLVEWLQPGMRRLKPSAAVETFAVSTRTEMDLRLEAAAAAELGENCADDPGFRVPRIDWRRTGRRVLTLERVEGLASDDREGMIEAGFDPDLILMRAAEILFKQVFRDGFFHADMHPGNMFIDDKGEMVPVDFGIMGRLDAATRRFLGEMLLGFLTADYKRVADVHFNAGYVPAGQDRAAFMQACRSIAEPIRDRPLNEISVGRLLGQLFEVTETFSMETQPQLLLLQKTMVVAEGVGRRLNPDVNMWELAQPLIESWMIDNLGPKAQIQTVIDDGIETLRRLPQLIERAEHALDSALDDGVKVDAAAWREHQNSLAPIGWAVLLVTAGMIIGALID